MPVCGLFVFPQFQKCLTTLLGSVFMQKIVEIEEVPRIMDELADLVEAGSEVIIARDGITVVKMIPVDQENEIETED